MSGPPREAGALEAFLHRAIPASAALGIRVEASDAAAVRLAAPLAPNVNDKGTAFAGSLYAVAVLCGWVAASHAAAEAGRPAAPVVIAEARVRYLRPARADLVAACARPDAAAVAALAERLAAGRRGRLALDVTVESAGEAVLALAGRYVAG
ncbi:YiiD C-terminal domain-containing protein [Inmirania thermothiophila]|uniref:Thioesterase domain-containing protein n=1 Tax=Inmirania thermothiophila TaxID=1750597 RepID=A0A3N1Y7V6_9GAMM|nr:YiiD C-terminal domain-containing protein [Inmirania thermothiophila]ROR34588.1 thioesterase domain-containing protein [Inmirania thermothiophila]